MDWIEAEGHTRTVDLWERYLTGPEEDSDPATWQTELTQPLAPSQQ
jgi:effector-binding domain-containing protein